VTWQDLIVGAVAFIAGAVVLMRTVGSWKDSKPGAPGDPHCDSCAIAVESKKGGKLEK